MVQTLKVEHIVLSLAFGPDGKTLAAGCDQHGGVRLWKKKDGQFAEERSLLKPATGLALAFSPDGRTLAAGDEGSGCIYLYDLQTGTDSLVAPDTATEVAAGHMSLSTDGRFLAYSSLKVGRPSTLLDGGERFIVGGRTWEVVHTPGHSPGHMCLWDAQARLLCSGDHLLQVVSPPVTFERGFEADPMGSYLASLDRVRDLAPDLVLPGHGAPFRDGAGEYRKPGAEAVRSRHRLDLR